MLNAHAPAFQLNAYAPLFVPRSFEPAVASSIPASDDLVVTEAAVLEACDRLRQERYIFVDCEGSDLSKGSWRNGALQEGGSLHGQLCLIQIGTTTGQVYAFDIVELGARAFDLGLRHLLEDPNIIKVVHDFRQDSDALWHQFEVSSNSLFDCQLCDVLIRRLNGPKTTYVMGSAKLLSANGIEAQSIPGYGVLTQDQKLLIHERFSEDRHLWERRPLPADMIAYAKADIFPLPRLHKLLLTELARLVSNAYAGYGMVVPRPEAIAENLVLIGSAAYNRQFLELQQCRCRLCCDARLSSRFDGCRVFTRLSNSLEPWLLQRLWRPEDEEPLPEPGPSRFYINEFDESVLRPEAQ
jgi:hypothetical protein